MAVLCYGVPMKRRDGRDGAPHGSFILFLPQRHGNVIQGILWLECDSIPNHMSMPGKRCILQGVLYASARLSIPWILPRQRRSPAHDATAWLIRRLYICILCTSIMMRPFYSAPLVARLKTPPDVGTPWGSQRSKKRHIISTSGNF